MRPLVPQIVKVTGSFRRAGPRAGARTGPRSGRPLLVAVLALLAAACGLVACGSEGSGSPAGGAAGAPAGDRAGDPTGGRAGGTAGAPPEDARTITTGLRAPWGLAFLPDGRAVVGERDTGRILLVPAGGGEPTEVTRLPDVHHAGESGLLGLAVSPEYESDGLIYAYYTTAADNRVVRFRLDGADPAGPEVEEVLTGLASARIHDGGRIAFGPDGNLYIGVGDAADPDLAQDPRSPNGKILRIRPDGRIPDDNPFPGSPVYSLGHRNVQGLAWDSAGRLWASEFGQNTFDELNLIRPGANYGWPEVEGSGDTRGGRFTNPVLTWTTDEASPSGIAIRDDILYMAALRGERLWVMNLDGETVSGQPRALFTGELGRLRTIELAPDGSLWVTTSNTDGRGDPRDGDDRIVLLR